MDYASLYIQRGVYLVIYFRCMFNVFGDDYRYISTEYSVHSVHMYSGSTYLYRERISDFYWRIHRREHLCQSSVDGLRPQPHGRTLDTDLADTATR